MGLHYRSPNATALAVIPAATTTPKAFSTTPLPATQVLVMGYKAERTVNAASVWIGPTGTDGKQSIEIVPGGIFALSGVNLEEWYVDSTTLNDGVLVLYW